MTTHRRLLERSRQVNEVWLRSWGCRVEHHGFCTSVSHPSVSDFNALYDLRSADDLEPALRLAGQMAAQTSRHPAILLPDTAAFVGAQHTLLSHGYEVRLRSETIVVEAAEAGRIAPGEVAVQPVTEDTVTLWVDLYVANYGVTGVPAWVNRERWLNAFRGEPRVHFFFLDLAGRARGTVQLVEANNGCCGVYSLTLPSASRRLHLLRLVGAAVVAASKQMGCQLISFDRLRSASRRGVHRSLRTLGRDGLRFYVVSSDMGYILAAEASSSLPSVPLR
jgi:hypothetical protein